jgi:hypothetical protein
VGQVLAWADAHHRRTGRWPGIESGPIPGTGDTWRRIDSALRLGLRGLAPGGSSLARLLAQRRGVRNQADLPPLTVAQVLRWADAHHRRTGDWPTEVSGPIPEAPGEGWHAVDRALRAGVRGFTAGSSLPRLLEARRGVPNLQGRPPLTVRQILTWADGYFERHGAWPRPGSGPVQGVPGRTWVGVQAALQSGRRAFPGGSSLARLLAQRRGVRNRKDPLPLTVGRVLRWARAHGRRTGEWPGRRSGPIAEAPGETWSMVDQALRYGLRGLPQGGSQFRLQARRRGD